jgi:multidrug efflux system membrane fusion protein
VALAALGLFIACSGDGKKPAADAGAPGIPVTVATTALQSVPLTVSAMGQVEAYNTVQVRSLVNGVLQTIGFQQGQEVKAGDLLFVIDRRPFQVALEQAEQALARDQAKLQDAIKLARRTARLVKRDYVTRQQYEDAASAAVSAKATVRGDQAAVDAARLDLANCVIRAPIGGRTGAFQLNVGNLVKALDTNPLVVINQVRPVRVSFSVPQTSLAQVRARADHGLTVTATPGQGAGGNAKVSRGVLRFVDNQVNTATGTLLLKADFPNPDEALWPGEFVRVTLTLGAERVVVAPSPAVQTSQTGSFVFVVQPDHTVASRQVQVGQSDERTAVITHGLNAGETVVTDGQLQLTPGAKVKVTPAQPSGRGNESGTGIGGSGEGR